LISEAIERMDKSATSLKALSPAVLGVAFLLIDKKVPAWLAVGVAAVAACIYWYLDAQYLGREQCVSFAKLSSISKADSNYPASFYSGEAYKLSKRLAFRQHWKPAQLYFGTWADIEAQAVNK
jgi:alpha-D-ribose 1-methylphosphonate 5-triphosphate synthase subunit PhnH